MKFRHSDGESRMIADVTPITDSPASNSGSGMMNARRSTQGRWLSMAILAAFAAVMLAVCTLPASALDYDMYVNDTGWWNASGEFNVSNAPIQHAIDNATVGNTIYVYNGSYTENVNVNKQLTLQGEGMDVVNVIAASSDDHVFEVTADLVNISGFNVTGATGDNKAGIHLSSRQHCNISDNNASGNYYGIYLVYSSNNMLTGNTASNNNNGIYLSSSSNNTLANNTANSNNFGICLESSSNNTLTNNTADSNNFGIYLHYFSNCNTLTGNTANSNTCGILLFSSSNNTLTNNNADSNNDRGIYLSSSSNYNADSNNNYGILLFSSSNNTLANNTANSNTNGIYLLSSSNNTLTNNTMSGNNYNFGIYATSLSDYTHNIDTNNTVDEKPIYYWINRQNAQIPDDAGFVGVVNSTNITVKNMVLTNNLHGVLFVYTNDSRVENVTASNNYYGIHLSSSRNNQIYNNYFNNTNNAYDSGYNTWNTTPTIGTNIIGGSWLGGNYWSDYDGVDTDNDDLGDTLTPYNSSSNITYGGDYHPLIYIPPEAPLPPSSSSGGVGVGSSDEPENVEETVVLRIYLQAGESSNYNFNDVVTSVDVTPDKTYGLVAAKIEVLKGRPSSITTDPPAGEIYKYVDVFVGTSGWSDDKFSSSVINFQVPATWFKENNIDPASVTLYRHKNGKWESLRTTLTGQAGGFYKYSSPTPGFSTFMILGQVEESSSGEPAAATDSGTVADPTPTPETTSDKGIPGFGIMLGIMGILIAVYSRRK